MTDRFSPLPIIRRHLQALRPKGAARMTTADRLTYAGLPLAAGVAVAVAVAAGLPLRDGSSQLLAATALFVGAMLTVFVFLANLRLKVSEESRYSYRRKLTQLITGTVASALYTVLVTMALAGCLAAVATLEVLRAPSVAPFTAGMVTVLGTHLFITILGVVRRMFGVYQIIFAADEGGSLEPVDPKDYRHQKGA